jgi:hypothetical protein
MNKLFIIEEYRVGAEVDRWRQGQVQAEEVEAKVRLVMESGQGERLRTRVTERKEPRPWRGKTAPPRSASSCWTPRPWCVPVLSVPTTFWRHPAFVCFFSVG